MSRRQEVLVALADAALAVERPHPVRVAIDGCSAAGKTTLSDELAATLRERTAREVIRVSIDQFRRAVALRTRFPQDSPESYYLDSWDNDGIRDKLLVPLGPGGTLSYRPALMDLAALTALDGPDRTATADAVLIADGCFLQRPELDPHWDLRIFVDIPLDAVRPRDRAQLVVDNRDFEAPRLTVRPHPSA
ncbi:uridylate kinase [Asanoa sp. NPDC049518]|uniref:uridylate kinase n=1 Tax=unclassified Asanoa TaxID=2685164 RepID=UPI003435208C